jgi:hypothetical protein
MVVRSLLATSKKAVTPARNWSVFAAEIARAQAAHSANVAAWIKQPGVQGFGVTSSADSPGEAALMIFLIRGASHNSIPAVIDGVRTRVRESSRFHAGLDGLRLSRGCSVPTPKDAKPGEAPSAQSKKTNLKGQRYLIRKTFLSLQKN